MTKVEEEIRPDWTGPERRKKPRTGNYHHDDSRVWANRDRQLIFTSTRFKNQGYLRLVCCKLLHVDHEKYVIWVENLEDSERVGYPATFHGDYHHTLRGAVDEFFRRAQRDGLKVLVP